MHYLTDWRENGIGDFSDVAEEHESPEKAALAHMDWLINECLDFDCELQETIETSCCPTYEMRVACEDGAIVDIDFEIVPVGFDLTKKWGHRVIWRIDVTKTEATQQRCRMAYFPTETHRTFGEMEAGFYVDHFCDTKGPCAECATMDEASK